MGGKREEEEGECVKMESGGRLEGVCEDGVWREGVVMKVTKKGRKNEKTLVCQERDRSGKWRVWK